MQIVIILIFCDSTSQPQKVLNFLLFDFTNFIDKNKIYFHLDLIKPRNYDTERDLARETKSC